MGKSEQLPPPKRQRLRRRASEPIHRFVNSAQNNYYAQMRFSRQSDAFVHDLHHTHNDASKPFPSSIQSYADFEHKYEFFTKNGNKKLLGRGAQSHVFKVRRISNTRKKFAAKITIYRDADTREQVLHENRLLHRFGNGLHIRDIYDDTLNRRLIFILPHGKALRAWWFGSGKASDTQNQNGVRRLFEREDAMKQELILKRILLAILCSLKRIHDAGYIHHDIKPPNILVTRRTNTESAEWIDGYAFHVIDYGLSVPCGRGECIELDAEDIRFGTFGYNAWELMQTQKQRQYAHSIDLYALGITLCELIVGRHSLRCYDEFRSAQQSFCYEKLIAEWEREQRFFEREAQTEFQGFSEDALYRRTLFLKCDHWRSHFGRQRGRSRNGDESVIRSVVIKELQYNTPFTTRFKNFISNCIRDDPQRRIRSVDEALKHDLFYNV